MNDTLKAVGNLGAELGAVKRENEKLREIAEDAGRELQAWIASFPRASHHQAKALIARISAALSQQAEPAEPAPAQDERKTFEVEIPDISAIYDGRSFIPYRSLEAGERLMTVAQHLRIEKQLRAALTRPAQTEQQPKEEIPKPDGWVAAGRFFTDRDEAIAAAEKTPCVDVYFRPSLLTVLARSAERQSVAEELARLLSQSNRDIRQLNAAPIAQAATQSEFGDAYQGAREDLAIWKRRALEAEQKVRHQEQVIDHLTQEAQGETRMGEPVIPQTAPRCQCCGYLVTDSEHRGCLRAATPSPAQRGEA